MGDFKDLWQKEYVADRYDCSLALLGTEFIIASTPALHCSWGGINKNDAWVNIRADGKFLYPVKALSKVYRAKFCAALKAKSPDDYTKVKKGLWSKPWVVYAKKPFGSAHSVIEYLGRYTHKIAISNNRIQEVDHKNVTFKYKDYRQNGTKKEMVLSHGEFIRRFAMHILPKRFVKIRHYVFLSSTWKRQKLQDLQKKMNFTPIARETKAVTIRKCQCCKVGNLHTILIFDTRGPPAWYLGSSQKIATQQS